jgi:hypothetical protein
MGLADVCTIVVRIGVVGVVALNGQRPVIERILNVGAGDVAGSFRTPTASTKHIR